MSGISSQPEMETFVVEVCKVQKTDSRLINAAFLWLVSFDGLEKLTTDGGYLNAYKKKGNNGNMGIFFNFYLHISTISLSGATQVWSWEYGVRRLNSSSSVLLRNSLPLGGTHFYFSISLTGFFPSTNIQGDKGFTTSAISLKSWC